MRVGAVGGIVVRTILAAVGGVALSSAVLVLFAGLGDAQTTLAVPLVAVGYALAGGAIALLCALARTYRVLFSPIAPISLLLATTLFPSLLIPLHWLIGLGAMLAAGLVVMATMDSWFASYLVRARDPTPLLKLSRLLFKDAVDARATELIAEPQPSDADPDRPQLAIKFIIRDEPRYHTPVPILYHSLFIEIHKRMAHVDTASEAGTGSAFVTLRGQPLHLHFTFYPTRLGEGMRVRIGQPRDAASG